MGEKGFPQTSILCQRCETKIPTFSAMRKWCVECRQVVSAEQARERKLRRKQRQ